jgi:hypothetical protein
MDGRTSPAVPKTSANDAVSNQIGALRLDGLSKSQGIRHHPSSRINSAEQRESPKTKKNPKSQSNLPKIMKASRSTGRTT